MSDEESLDKEAEAVIALGKVSNYKIIEYLGKGACGYVFKGEQEGLGIPVAIKVLKKDFITDDEKASRFVKEAQAAANLIHPNIVRVYDFGLEEELVYYVMEFAPKGTLKDRLAADFRLSEEETIDVGLDICRALIEAESKAVVHRDIKPDNIMVAEDGSYKLVDLGLAKDLNQDITRVGELTTKFSGLGTPAFMAPEQAVNAKGVDNRADIYSLGIVLYQAATGLLPFNSGDIRELFRMHAEVLPLAPNMKNRSLSPAFSEVVLRALSKLSSQRYQTAREFYQALEHLKKNPQTATNDLDETQNAQSVAKTPAKSHLLILVLLLIVVILLAVILLNAEKF